MDMRNLMTKILIAVPTFENVSTETFESIYNLQIPPETDVKLYFAKGYDCARARNRIVEYAIDKNYDYIFMVDSDIVLPNDALLKLYEVPTNIILGAYPRKNEPSKSELFDVRWDNYAPSARWNIAELTANRFTRDGQPITAIPVLGGGFGCALLKTNIFRSGLLAKPWFKYVNYGDGDLLSEDLYFCENARRHGFKIYASTTFVCGHVKREVITYEKTIK